MISRLALVGRHTPDVAALVAVIRRLTTCRCLQEIMETVTPAARTLLGADGVTFVLREGDFCYYAEENAISPLWKGRRFPMSACISGWCMEHRRAVSIPDIYSDSRIPQDAYRPTFVRSLAMVPVRQDDPVGAMGAYWSEPRSPGAGELELLQTMANAAALALANIQLSEHGEVGDRARGELAHRIRNVLAVVDALARQSLRRAADMDEFGATFLAQLHALARAQTVLEGLDGAEVDLDTLVQEQVVLVQAANRVCTDGPPLALSGKVIVDLAMVLHELATNARKHGALSNDTGTIAIDWHVRRNGEHEVLELSWRERGGPPVKSSPQPGQGSRLVRGAFDRIGGKIETAYAAEGFECSMIVPL